MQSIEGGWDIVATKGKVMPATMHEPHTEHVEAIILASHSVSAPIDGPVTGDLDARPRSARYDVRCSLRDGREGGHRSNDEGRIGGVQVSGESQAKH
jgi:hypothetical protein